MSLPGLFKGTAGSLMLACSLVFLLLLVACGGTTSTSGSTPTPTSPPAASTPTSSTSSTTLTTYTGNGYTIGYPQGWKVNSASNGVVFADSTGMYSVSIAGVPDPGGTISADTVLNTAVQLATSNFKNVQTLNVPASTTIGGDTWAQKSLTGTSSATGLTGTVQVVIVADNHPANSPATNSYTITYQTLQSSFDTANTQYFQPMIQSFKFTS